MATNDQAGSREIDYPESITKNKAKKKYKKKILRNNPDILYADYSDHEGIRIKSNLIFYTTLITEWKSVIDNEYQHVVRTEIDHGERFFIFRDEVHDTNNRILTISFYTTDTVLVQNSEENLNSFEKTFAQLKVRVQTEREQAQMNKPNNNPTSPPPPPSNHQLRDGEERAEERDQPQAAAEDTSSSIIDHFNNLSVGGGM